MCKETKPNQSKSSLEVLLQHIRTRQSLAAEADKLEGGKQLEITLSAGRENLLENYGNLEESKIKRWKETDY